MSHTPGPWMVVPAEDGGGYTIYNPIVDHESNQLMHDPVVWEMGGIDTLANAHLIAAAPELLEVCKLAVKLHGESYAYRLSPTTLEAMRNAIAKATDL